MKPFFQSSDEESNSGSRVGCCDTTTKRLFWFLVVLGFLIIPAILLFMSLEKLKSTEYGVKYTPYSKKLDDDAETGGLYAGPPGFEFIKFPSTFITVDLETGTCVSQDGLRVEFKVTFQYQMPEEWLLPVIMKYRNFEKWAQIVEAAGNSAVQHSCSEFQVSNFQNKRGVIQSTMEDNLRIKLAGKDDDGEGGVYARAVSLQLRNVELPDQYQSAVAMKQSAAEDIALAKNQRTQETTKAQTALLTAKEESRKILDTAVNDANVTITEAVLKAEYTTFSFLTEAEVLANVKRLLNLTTEGILAYSANQLYGEAASLRVSAAEPARLSRKDEL